LLIQLGQLATAHTLYLRLRTTQGLVDFLMVVGETFLQTNMNIQPGLLETLGKVRGVVVFRPNMSHAVCPMIIAW
jgi:hypothetical protein